MIKVLATALLIFVLGTLQAAQEFRRDTVLMGVSFNIGVVHKDATVAHSAISLAFEEVVRIERLISSWDERSQTSKINRNAGIAPVKVDKELFDLIARSQKISELSNGYFDISFSSIHKVWDFENFKQTLIPSDSAIAASVELIDHRKIKLNPTDTTVFLETKGMRIGFGAMGKGYAANKVKALLLEIGIEHALVNAGGDLIAWGKKADGSPWMVGVTDPFDPSKSEISIEASDLAVVTSGNYKKFIEIDGKRYCHIINPKTGWPVQGLASVTIMSLDAELADALATTVFVIGREEGMKLVDHLDGVACLIIDTDGKRYLSER